ncbi:uncharacterized protein METZ01_LOCUS188417, partial [marine metagenome]
RATNRRVEIKILKAMEVAKDEAQKAKQKATDEKKPGTSTESPPSKELPRKPA